MPRSAQETETSLRPWDVWGGRGERAVWLGTSPNLGKCVNRTRGWGVAGQCEQKGRMPPRVPGWVAGLLGRGGAVLGGGLGSC